MLSTATTNPYRAIEMGRGGYTLQKFRDNLDVWFDGQFTSSIIDDVLTTCQTSTNYLDKCQQALGTTQQPTYILLNLGANDVGFVLPWVLPNQTTWRNNYVAVVDILHAQWPAAIIAITKPWKFQTGGDNTMWDAFAASVDAVQAARPAFTIVLDDERAWLQGHQEYSPDTPPTIIHFNTPLGSVTAASAKLVALGF